MMLLIEKFNKKCLNTYINCVKIDYCEMKNDWKVKFEYKYVLNTR